MKDLRLKAWGVISLAGVGLACSVSASQLMGWGAGYVGPTYLPTNFTSTIAFAAQDGHTLALKVDGAVTNFGSFLWSDNHSGYLFVRAGLSNIVCVAAGYGHDVVLTREGTVLAWGYQTSVFTTNVPLNLTNAAAIATHYQNSLALRNDGSVVAWGSYFYDLDIPQGLAQNVLKIAAGAYHFLALKADGTITGWGRSDYATVPPGLSNVVAIAAAWSHSLALKSDGTVVAWGNNSFGQLNVPYGLTNVVAICAAGYHSLAIRADGSLVTWGYNYYGQRNVPIGVTNVAAVGGGRYNTIALLGEVAPYPTSLPSSVTVPYGTRVLLSSSMVGTKPLTYQWSFNGTELPGKTNLALSLDSVSFNQEGNYGVIVRNSFGTATNSYTLKVAPLVIGVQPNNQTVFADTTAIFNVRAEGVPPIHYQWSFDGMNLPGETSNSLVLSNVLPQDAGTYSVLVSNAYTTLTSSNAQLEVQPLGIIGQPEDYSVLLRRTANFSVTAVGVPPLSYQWLFNDGILPGATNSSLVLNDVQTNQAGSYAVVVSNAYTSLQSAKARLNVNELLGWGGNFNGQLSLPAALNSVVAIAAGDRSSCALRANGSVIAWGDNSYGQATVPGGLTNVVAIAAGAYFNLALKADGLVTAWGDNSFGQTNVPAGLSNVVAISGGSSHALVLTSEGRVFGWGRNSEGQADSPATITNAVAIACGRLHSMALRSDRTVFVWGDNSFGQTNLPAGLTNVAGIACGSRHNLFLKTDGTVFAWGDNLYGQIDVPVALVTNIVGISANIYNNLALRSDGRVVAWGNNFWGQTNVPADLSNVVAIACGHYNSLVLVGSTPPVVHASIVDPSWSSAQFSVRLTTRSGRAYALETKDSLANNFWTALPLSAGNGAVLRLTDSTATNSQRFYRVQEW